MPHNWWLVEIQAGIRGQKGNRDKVCNFVCAAEEFMWSPEFRGYVNAERGDTIPNDVFLNHMYQGVFGRAPDAGGFTYWMKKLNNGFRGQAPGYRSQVQALVDMTQSNEYVELTVKRAVDYLY